MKEPIPPQRARAAVTAGFLLTISLAGAALAPVRPGESAVSIAQISNQERARIRKGFAIAPVRLNLKGKNRNLVGLGSYIVNAQAGCNDCHTCPSFEPGHNPFEGGDGKINAENYLAGGVSFGPDIVSANITPDEEGLPAGLTFKEYLHLIRTGEDEDEPGELLQVMPWPNFRKMNDHDIRAIYEYLSAIPHAEPGDCSGPEE